MAIIGTLVQKSPDEQASIRPSVSHTVRRLPREPDKYKWPLVTKALFEHAVRQSCPGPHEQADNLVNWLGAQLKLTPQGKATETIIALSAIIGTNDMSEGGSGVRYVTQHLYEQKLIGIEGPVRTDGSAPSMRFTLTFAGWDRFYALQKTVTDSRNAFMAMKFGDPAVDGIYRDCFVPAVLKTGYTLRRLDATLGAGLIDNQLRAEIRAAAFLVADLTHANLGAYWEAGFAEGLGKPVIYTCSKRVFDEVRTHFDVNHHTTIRWDADDLGKAAEELKATIRNTLPADAKMLDE